jgi:hypothetical protein
MSTAWLLCLAVTVLLVAESVWNQCVPCQNQIDGRDIDDRRSTLIQDLSATYN